MSNAFVSIIFKLPCLARPARNDATSHLFSTLRQCHSLCRNSSIRIHQVTEETHRSSRPSLWARSFTSTNSLNIRQRRIPSKLNGDTPGAKLEPARRQASHTEGIVDNKIWRDYDPAGGLPLPSGELSHAEITAIFGSETVNVETGNYILSVLHWRRMSGALIDNGLQFPRDSSVSPDQAVQGLEYLRKTMPEINEQENGVRWAEEESQRLQQVLQQRAVNLKLYKQDPSAEEELIEEEEEEESKQGTAYGRARTGTSAFDELRGALKTRNEARESAKVVAQANKERALLHASRGPLELAGGLQPLVAVQKFVTGDIVIRNADINGTLMPVARKPWVQYYEKQAMVTQENKVPQLSIIQRLVPGLLLVLTTLGLCVYLSDNYTPPPQSARLFPDTPPSVATIAGITAVMLATFVLSRMPPLWRANSKYFCVVSAYPYAISLIGAIFRHDTLSHLARNMIMLWLIGLSVHEDVGRGTFLAIFLGSGVVGGYSSLLHNVLRQRWMTYTFGGSGAVLGLLGALCTLRPHGTISILGYEIPIAAWLFLFLFGGAEVTRAFRRTSSNIDHVGHVGGLLTGVAAAFYLRMKTSRQKAVQSASRANDPVMASIDAV